MLAPTRLPGAERLVDSLLQAGTCTSADVRSWLDALASDAWMKVDRVDLDDVAGWERDPATGNLRHVTGKFFTVESVDVELPEAAVPRWSQPIINQPEVGVLGVLVKEIDGLMHCLVQAKHEPGNVNGLQLSPTVQATRSNYTQVHKGRPVPYLEHFQNPTPGDVLVDIRQSEQGAWFYRKRNRNMVVEAVGDVPVVDGFRWLSLRDLAELLSVPDLVNMDLRTVLACLPLSGEKLVASRHDSVSDEFGGALVRSLDPQAPTVHTDGDVLSWITDARARTELRVTPGPLDRVPGWTRRRDAIAHDSGRFFEVVAVRVEAGGREVGAWSQPMIKPVGTGLIAFLVKPIDGVLHVLTHARVEPGYADVVELGPTVQCLPDNHPDPASRPRFLNEVLDAPPERVRFDTVLSEEGGRFLNARNRYVIVETDLPTTLDDPEYRWLALHQHARLLQHSFYVNIQARSLLLGLTSLLPRA